MTIDDLNALTTLTAADEVPVWDSEESGEPTKKITASNLAASVKSLAGLPNTTEMNTAIQQSTATVDDKLSKSVRYVGTTPVDTGIIATDDNHTLKRVRLYNTALSMPSGSWVQVGTLASTAWVLGITGFFRISTDSQKAFFVGRYFDVRWDINTGIIYAMQNYSSSTITVAVNLTVDYA